MKRLTERTEIATAINFHKYPTIKIDLADRDDYGIRGTKVNIDFGGDYYIHGVIRTYNDEKVLTTAQGCTCLAADIHYEDYLEMVEYANAPIIKGEQEILIFLYNSVTKQIYAPVVLKTGKVSRHCSTPLSIERCEIL